MNELEFEELVAHYRFIFTQQIAYQLWENDGKKPDNDLEYWFKAEMILDNSYISNISFRCLESEFNESVTIISNNKIWEV